MPWSVAAAGSKEAPLLVSDALVVGLLLVGFFEALRRRNLELDRVAGAALIFIGVGGFSALLAAPRFGLSAFELAFSLAYLAYIPFPVVYFWYLWRRVSVKEREHRILITNIFTTKKLIKSKASLFETSCSDNRTFLWGAYIQSMSVVKMNGLFF